MSRLAIGLGSLIRWLQRRTDDVAVALLTAMFFVFILQIFCRYVLNFPLGWTLEACLLCWLWLVFWGCAFNVDDHEHVRFDILHTAAPAAIRKLFAIVASIAIIAAFALSFPASYDFIAFMKIESTSLLKLRFDFVFSIYLIFAAAVIIRYGLRLYRLVFTNVSHDENTGHLR